MGLHQDEIEIGPTLVRGLVDRTFPELADRPLTPLASSGSTNAMFRLGRDLLVRLPRQPGGSAAIDKEARWLPYLTGALPVATPVVVAVGEPGPEYPERWSIMTWLDGEPPGVPVDDAAQHRFALDLAGVVRALRRTPVPSRALADPALGSYRSEPLVALDPTVQGYLAQCHDLPGLDLDLAACRRVWDAAMTVPGADRAGPPRWLHGDLFAENLLVRKGRLGAVLDFGGLAVGDPTVDLAGAWELLGPPARQVFRAAVDADDATWSRGRAWALAVALMTFPYYWRTMPARCASRLVMARAVLADG